MLKSVELFDFRAFHHLRLEGFGRVNLLVGKNNSGKTSVLEGVEMLVGGGTATSLLRSVRRRGEILMQQEEQPQAGLDISHLFYGHGFEIGSTFTLKGFNDKVVSLACEIMPRSSDPVWQANLFNIEDTSSVSLVLKHSDRKEPLAVPLSINGGVTNDVVRRMTMFEQDLFLEGRQAKPVASHFVTADSISAPAMSALWDLIALTPEEEQVIKALQIIDKDIERIAFLSADPSRQARRNTGGILIKLRDLKNRVPLGSMGDGVKRLLALSLSIIRSQRGYAFIDEIDTGLHHSVMPKMWEMIIEIARRLDIQVFATTHSQDCVSSLASLYQQRSDICDDIRLHRIENGLDHAILYSPHELQEASKHHIEVRGW